MKQIILRREKFFIVGWLLLVLVLFAFIHHQRHIQFLTTGWDLSVFDQPIFLASLGQTPFSSLHNTHTLGDHFHPLLLLVGPILYKIWPDPRMLLWFEVGIAVASAAIIYALAKSVLGEIKGLTRFHRLLLSAALSAMYVFSVGFQSMVLDDFHDDVLITLPLALTFLFLYRRHWLYYWLSIVWILLTKEEFGLLVAALGLFIIVKYRFVKIGLTTMVLGVATFFLLIGVIMPKFSSGSSGQYSYLHFSATNRPGMVLKRFASQPSLIVTTLFDHPAKRQTLSTGIISFAGLPLLAPLYVIPIWESLMIRFIDSTAPLRFSFNNHYNGPLVTLLSVASVYGAGYLLKWRPRLAIPLLLWIILITLTQNVLFHGPINSVIKPAFYELQPWQIDAQALIAQVPKTGSLATQNFLLPHLSQRESYSLLPEVRDADYIAFTTADNPNDFYGPNPKDLQVLMQNLLNEDRYRILWQQNQSFLLERIKMN